MSLELFKPNKGNTGFAAFIQIAKDRGGEPCMYVKFVKQASWNEKTKTGSFKENISKEGCYASLKLSETEIGAIINVIRENGKTKFSTVHRFQNNGSTSQTSVSFAPYTKTVTDKIFENGKTSESERSYTVFRFGLTKEGNQKFGVSLEPSEAILLEEYMKLYLHKYFEYRITKNEEYFANKNKQS